MVPTGVPAPSVEQMTAMEEQNGIAGDVSQLRIGHVGQNNASEYSSRPVFASPW